MVLTSHPFLMGPLLGCSLQGKYLSRLRDAANSGDCLSNRGVIDNINAAIYLLAYQLSDLIIGRSISLICRNIDNICVIGLVRTVGHGHVDIRVFLSSSVPIDGIGEPLKELLVLLEELLVLVDSVEDSLLVDIALCESFGSLWLKLTIIEFEYVFMPAFEVIFKFKIDNFGVVDADGTTSGLLAHDLVDQVHGFCRKLNQ